ncbi:MAG TPA: hypothetical protein VG937_21225 [Polyangiaceae bacterium]|nr:hypothetical protein [Polyangiaceae bacterium]
MDPREMETLVQRLVQNPHDQDAIGYAHQAGQADPRSYAMLLEKVGTATADPAFASHWLTEAANVWSTSLGDAHRAARALMIAIDRDPTQPTPAERLADLYREKGDSKALVALLERRAKALAPIAQQSPEMRPHVAAIHEELGRLWSEAPLSQPKKAVENFRRAIEFDPSSQYSIYALREMYKAQGQWADAIPLFDLELRLVDDNERRIALLLDEAEVRRSAGDLAGATQAFRAARDAEGGNDATLKQQYAAVVLERVQAREAVPTEEREEAGQLFVDLAEEYPGEHGFSYSICALELSQGHDRAMQLAIYYGEQLGRVNEVAPHAAAYLRANPQGALTAEARNIVTQAMELGGDESLLDALGPAPGAGADEQVASLVEVAQALARKAKKNEAAAKYREVLAIAPDNTDALGFLEGYFRQTRKFVELRDMLLVAARSENADVDQRKGWLKEVATLCESQLRDPASAITALKESVALDPDDETARSQLKRLLEKSGQWDALAEVLTQEAEQTIDVEARISLEKALAKLHEQRRKDPIATGETWARIASLSPDDDEAILTAVGHFERAQRSDLAAKAIADNLEPISDERTRAALLEKLGELRVALGDALGAGEAFAEGGALTKNAKLWHAAERSFVHAEAWDQAATAIDERAGLASADIEKSVLYATEAEYLTRAGDETSSVLRLEQATDLDPENEEFAGKLEARYDQAERREDLANFLLKRADRLRDKAARIGLRKRAATLQRDALGDVESARATLIAVLDDGDEPEALLWLADDAQQGGEPKAAAEYLARLVKVSTDPEKKVEYALREASLVADGLDDLEGAVERYGVVLKDLDPKNVGALERIADLNDRLERPAKAAEALEKRLELLTETDAKLATAERLAALYEGPLDDPRAAIRVLDVIRGLEPENFDAVQRLCELCERVEDWPRVADLTAVLIEVEGDEEEVSRMTRRLAEILHKNVGKGDEALAALMGVADAGDEPCREEYVRLGDELGWKGIVASKLVEWYVDAPIGPARNDALRGAFDRFLAVGRDADAANVAKELARTRGADVELAQKLETIAVNLKDLDALGIAHDLIAQQLAGPARAEELVRQAEVLVEAGVEPGEAVQHGEQALTSVAPSEVAPLLERLAKITKEPGAIIDIYERQVTRCKVPADRLQALARAAQVAAQHEVFDRARQFLDVALGGSVQEETLAALEDAARESDLERGGDRLRRTLAEALSAGGQGSRDGGRTRGALLGRASQLAYNDLQDTAQAFIWLGDAIVAHVDDERLGQLEALANEVGEPKRAETVLSRALEEVFDGPLVRKLLARRATLRRERLDDLTGAAVDLKRLHDLSPSDTQVMEQLSGLYTELKDYRGMVQLYEDQILRGKDPASRAELARKVARLWEEELDDPREAADAWRRVLRMKAGDAEATQGLERAKSNMLKHKSEPVSDAVGKPPPAPPAAPPAERSSPKAAEPPPVATSSAASEEAPAPAPKASEEPDEPLPLAGVTLADLTQTVQDPVRSPLAPPVEAAAPEPVAPVEPVELPAAPVVEPAVVVPEPATAAAISEPEDTSFPVDMDEPAAEPASEALAPPAPVAAEGLAGLEEAVTGRRPPAKPGKKPDLPPSAPSQSRPGAPPPPPPSSIRPPPPASKSRSATPPPPPIGSRPPLPPPGGRAGNKAPPPPPIAKRSGPPMLDASLGAGSSPANGGVRAPSAVGSELDDEELSVDDDELIDE